MALEKLPRCARVSAKSRPASLPTHGTPSGTFDFLARPWMICTTTSTRIEARAAGLVTSSKGCIMLNGGLRMVCETRGKSRVKDHI